MALFLKIGIRQRPGSLNGAKPLDRLKKSAEKDGNHRYFFSKLALTELPGKVFRMSWNENQIAVVIDIQRKLSL